MDMSNRKYRAVNFDLQEQKLKEYFSADNPKLAYKKLAKFFNSYEFEHRQYSGYKSIHPLSDAEIMNIMDILYDKFPWLDNCAKRMDITTIEAIYDVKTIRESKVNINANMLKK